MNYLIIGNCATGVNAVEAIRGKDQKGKITVISDENYPAYCRCLISNYLAGTHQEENLSLREKDFYKNNRIELILNEKVESVKPEDKRIVLSANKELKYDKLLIATGGSPKFLGVEGENKYGVFGFRTLNDAKEISKLIPRAKKVLVFGGGLIGLKAGYALKQKGMAVEIIVKSSRVLSQVIDSDSAEMVGRWLMENGIKIRTGLAPKKILGKEEVEGVLLDNEEKVDCQVIIIGKGVRPNMDLVKDSKIQTHWGIITNQYLQTNVENVYAGGDVAETTDLITGESTINALWTAATEQGRIAGLNMAGEKREYPGSIAANSIDFFGLPIISLGYVRVKEKGYEEFVHSQPKKYQYKKIVLKGNRLVGAIFVGNIENAGVYLALIRRQVDISGIKDILLEDWFDYSKVSELLELKEGFRETVSLQGEPIRMLKEEKYGREKYR